MAHLVLGPLLQAFVPRSAQTLLIQLAVQRTEKRKINWELGFGDKDNLLWSKVKEFVKVSRGDSFNQCRHGETRPSQSAQEFNLGFLSESLIGL